MTWSINQNRIQPPNRYFLLVMIGAFLLPLFGPLLDHQYAEKQPSHQHLYLDSINLLHHGHHQSDHVVSLPSLDTTGPVSLVPFLPSGQAIVWPSLLSGELAFSLTDEISFSQGISPAPLDRPPQ